MSDCQKLDSLVTPYVDGEAPAADRAVVDAHLGRCAPCQARVVAERATRELVRARKAALVNECASSRLRERCRAAIGREPSAGTGQPAAVARRLSILSRARGHAMPLALAASLTLVVGGAFVYEATSRSSHVLAAELAADHVKCFAANRLVGVRAEPANDARSYLQSSFGWNAQLPQLAGLALESARPCLYGEGRVAHVMYRYGGRPVSLFMLPGTTRREEVVEVMGHEAAIWSADGRTFVLVARESRDEVQRLAAAIHNGLR